MKLIIQPQRQRRLADPQPCRKNNVRPQLLTDPCPKPDIIKMHSQSSLSFKKYPLPLQEIPRFCIFYKISFLFIEHMFYINLRIELSPPSVNRRFRSPANPIFKNGRESVLS